MKRLIITMICAVMALGAMAQTEHMKFKGIPMDCSVDEMARKLQAKGYEYFDKVDDNILLKGSFAGYDDCTIGILPIEGDNKIWRVAVFSRDYDNWNSLYNNYSYLKDMLSQKYSEPYSIERFEGSSEPTNDFNKMLEVLFDKCKYISEFYTHSGIIRLSINKSTTYGKAYVTLLYEDGANAELHEKNAMDDL